MKGLELCERYFREEGQPALEREFGPLLDRMAIGLVGDGSECYGYDDEISQDHDWGPGFCIWLTRSDYEAVGGRVKEVYDGLPRTYRGYSQRLSSQWGGGRVGVLEITAFYSGFVGRYQPPGDYDEWLVLPENALRDEIDLLCISIRWDFQFESICDFVSQLPPRSAPSSEATRQRKR